LLLDYESFLVFSEIDVVISHQSFWFFLILIKSGQIFNQFSNLGVLLEVYGGLIEQGIDFQYSIF